MSPLEQYQHDKRSGKYHPETLKNWPDKIETQQTVEDIVSNIPDVQETLQSHMRDWININDQLGNLKEDQHSKNKIIFIWLTALTIATGYLIARSQPTPKNTKQVIKVPSVKKVYVTKTSDKWRKIACYQHGNWKACTAYKTDLPLRARVGRTDLN